MELKRRRWLVLAFIGALLLAPYLVLRFSASRGVQKQFEAIRAKGLPASPLELDHWYRSVSASSNRALVILEAAKLYRATVGTNRLDKIRLAPESSVSPRVWKQVKSLVEANRAALDLLHEAGALPESRYPIDLSSGPSTLLPHLAPVKNLVELARMNAIYESHCTNSPAAVQSIISAFAVADSLRDEPIWVSQAVRMDAVEQSVSALSRVLSEHALSTESLQRLSASVAAAESAGRAASFRALVGERALSTGLFEMTFAEMEKLGMPDFPPGPAGLQMLAFQLYRASGIRFRDISFYLQTMDDFISSAAKDLPESIPAFQRTEKRLSEQLPRGLNQFAALSRMLLVPVGKLWLKEANSVALLRCAQVALAIEKHRQDHGQNLPATLNELSPTYLYKLPVDPYNGGALQWETLPGKGYRVFAPGATAANRGYISANITNLTFVVRR